MSFTRIAAYTGDPDRLCASRALAPEELPVGEGMTMHIDALNRKVRIERIDRACGYFLASPAEVSVLRAAYGWSATVPVDEPAAPMAA